MKPIRLFVYGLWLTGLLGPAAQAVDAPNASEKQEQSFETDTIQTESGELTFTFIGHGTLMMTWADKVIHVDPWTQLADYTKLPKADLILITHEHRDHLDTKAVNLLRKEGTIAVLTEKCLEAVPNGVVMKNGDKKKLLDLEIEAVPAYNLVHKRPDGQPFHPKGQGNGYVLSFGKTRVYIAGDTENIPEMQNLNDIAVAFLPMNLPYTMTPQMTAEAAKLFRPKILYPYHYGQTDPNELVRLLAEEKDIEVRIRKMP